MARILGLDVGKRALRGALVRTALKKLEVLRYVEVPLAPLPPGAADAEAAAEALRDACATLLAALGQPVDRVVTSLDGREASLRVLELPAGAAKRIAEVLPFELETLLPFDPAESVLDHQPIGVVDGQLRVLACAVPKERVVAHLARLAAAGAEPKEIAVGAAALDGLVPLLPALAGDTTTLLLEVDEDRTELCVLRGGRAELARTLSAGIAHAESGLLEAELRRALSAHRASGGATPAQVWLLGDAASDPNAVEWLGQRLELEVRPLPLPPAEGMDDRGAARFGRAAALGCRTALRTRRLDLRKGDLAPTRALGALRSQLRYVGLAAAVVLASFLFATGARWATLADEREVLRAELAQTTEASFGVETHSASRARRLLEEGAGHDDPLPRFDAYDILDAVSQRIPEDITHNTRRLHIELDEDGHGGRFELHGMVASVAERDRISQELQAHECVAAIENGRTSPGPGGQGLNYQIEGTVRCPGAPEPEDRRRRRRSDG